MKWKNKLMNIGLAIFFATFVFAISTPAPANAADLGPAFIAEFNGQYAYVVTATAYQAAKGKFANLQAPHTMWRVEQKEMGQSTNGAFYRAFSDTADERWNVQIKDNRWLPFELADLAAQKKLGALVVPDGLLINNLDGNGKDFAGIIKKVDEATWNSLK